MSHMINMIKQAFLSPHLLSTQDLTYSNRNSSKKLIYNCWQALENTTFIK